MVTAVSTTISSGAKQKILAFCDQWLPIYESKVRRQKLASLTVRLRRATENHFSQREKIVLARLQYIWPEKEEAVERLSRADWITMHIFETDEEEALLSALFNPFYMESGEAGSLQAIRRLSSQIGRDIVFKGSTQWIQANAIRFGKKYAESISETTNQAIRDQIAEAIRQGEGIGEVMDRIASVYQSAEGYRSEMIGRTEMGRAYNISSLRQDEALGITLEDMVGCNPLCPECGPFMASNPHTVAEVIAFEQSVHPNHGGAPVARVPEGFIPNETGN